MKDFLELLKLLGNTPIPVLLVGGGLVFLFISVGGQFGATIKANKRIKEKHAVVIGFILLSTGIALYAVPAIFSGDSKPPKQKVTSKVNIDALTGTWEGTIQVVREGDRDVVITINNACEVGLDCGTLDFPAIPCSARISLTSVQGDIFQFQRTSLSGERCSIDVQDSLQPFADGKLYYVFKGRGKIKEGRGFLQKTGN